MGHAREKRGLSRSGLSTTFDLRSCLKGARVKQAQLQLHTIDPVGRNRLPSHHRHICTAWVSLNQCKHVTRWRPARLYASNTFASEQHLSQELARMYVPPFKFCRSGIIGYPLRRLSLWFAKLSADRDQ